MAAEDEIRVKDVTPTIDAFRTGDKMLIDGPSGTANMSKDTLLELTAQNALDSIKNLPTKYKGFMALDDADGTGKMDVDTVFNNFSGKFDPDRTSDTAYKVGEKVVHLGALYMFKNTHYGAWNASDVFQLPVSALFTDRQGLVDVSSDDNIFVKVLRSSDFVAKGRIDDSGNWVSHNQRASTFEFIPVHEGDLVKFIYNGVIESYATAKVFFYNSAKVFLSASAQTAFIVRGGGGNVIVPSGVSYVRVMIFTTNNVTDTTQFDKCVYIERFNFVKFFGHSLNAVNEKIYPTSLDLMLTSDFLEQGVYSVESGHVTGVGGHNARVRNAYPIKLHKGDSVNCFDYSVTFSYFLCDGTDAVLQTAEYIHSFTAAYDGIVYLHCKNSTGSAITPADIANKIVVRRKSSSLLFISDASYLHNGYWKDDLTIGYHAARLVNLIDIVCNKGDKIRVNSPLLQMVVREVSLTGTQLTGPSEYYSGKYAAPGTTTKCAPYVVQNDNCKVLVQFAPTYTSGLSTLSPSDFPDCILIERASSVEYKELTRKWITPNSNKRGRIIPCTDKSMQDGCVVNGKLWMSTDNYGGIQVINVINIETGVIERTITHDFGHNGICKYCAETDTALIVNEEDVYLYPNLSSVTTSMMKSSATQVTIPEGGYTRGGCACWGEDKQTIYILVPYNYTDSVLVNKVYKYRLEMNGSIYTGNTVLEKSYDLVIKDDIDCNFGPNNGKYAQSLDYDGYLYFAYGTSGHNFLILDFDDRLLTCSCVGRYECEYKDADGTIRWLEPELVALNGSTIICGSRNYTDDLVQLVELSR